MVQYLDDLQSVQARQLIIEQHHIIGRLRSRCWQAGQRLRGIFHYFEVNMRGILRQMAARQIDVKCIVFDIQHAHRARLARGFVAMPRQRCLQNLGQALQVILMFDNIVVSTGFKRCYSRFLIS